jgi:hypothetical protein
MKYGMKAPVVLLAVVVLAGCGGSSHRTAATTEATVPAYGGYSSTTEKVSVGAPGRCRLDADAFAADSVSFLAHMDPRAMYPADVFLLDGRRTLVEFRSARCDNSLLGRSLARRLTPAQRRALVAELPRTMGQAVLEALAAT